MKPGERRRVSENIRDRHAEILFIRVLAIRPTLPSWEVLKAFLPF